MGAKSLIPHIGNHSTREEIDRLFSRKMLGSVLVGKFIGDYTALMFTRHMGTDLGYVSGILFAVSVFIYWEYLEQKADETRELVDEFAGN